MPRASRSKSKSVPPPSLHSEGKDYTAWLEFMDRAHPDGPRLHQKAVCFKTLKAKKKAKPHEYELPARGVDSSRLKKDGKAVSTKHKAGLWKDWVEYDTIPGFVNHEKEGKSMHVAYFAVGTASASATHEEKVTEAHAFVAFIAQAPNGRMALYIYDSDVKDLSLFKPKGSGQCNFYQQGKRACLQTHAYHLHKYLSKKDGRNIQDVYLWAEQRGDMRCTEHTARVITQLMERGDGPVKEGEFPEYRKLELA